MMRDKVIQSDTGHNSTQHTHSRFREQYVLLATTHKHTFTICLHVPPVARLPAVATSNSGTCSHKDN